MRSSKTGGFTMPELVVGMGVASLVGAGLLAFSSISTRLVARNLGVNHSNEAVRLTSLQLNKDLHGSYSNFTLVNCTDSTTLADITASSTSDVDPTSQANLSTRAQGVRFRMLAGGPYRLTQNAAITATSLTFTLSGDGSYRPQVGDKIFFPLIRRELDISGITTAPTSNTSSFTVSTAAPLNHEFMDVSGQVTTAYFLRKVAYSVFDNKLRFHGRIPAQTANDVVVIREGITNPKPFALLCSAGTPDPTKVRISLESYDRTYSARSFRAGTVTLQTTIAPRTSSNMFVQTD